MKGIDGSLRYSIHRVTGELVYLPIPSKARQRAKPLIDGALVRAAQTATGAALLALGGTSLLGARPLGAAIAALAACWLGVVVAMRRPYLTLLRQAITSGSIDVTEGSEPIDIETTQLLVQRLASDDPFEVEAAMTVLSRRQRGGFVPALVLLHGDEHVLLLALEMFGESARADWFALARRLLADSRETVRVAAARALARHEQLDPASLAHDAGCRARGYAAVRMALRDTWAEVTQHESVRAALAKAGEEGESARLGMIAATLRDYSCARRLRVHLPKTIARFSTRRAAECLLEEIETQEDGLVRYKAIQALRTLATGRRIPVERRRTERLCAAELEEYFVRLGLRHALEPRGDGPEGTMMTALLLELLNEKAAHALERSFQLLQIARPRQGVHHAYVACRSDDAYARATAAELVDTLLRGTEQRRLRALFRLATDDLPLAERVARAPSLGLRLPRTREDALAAMSHSPDPLLSALAARQQADRPSVPARVIPFPQTGVR
jgi:hypothetical protein